MPGYWLKLFLGQHTLITSTIDYQLSLEYNEPIRTQFRSDSLQIDLANQITCLAHFIESFHVSSVYVIQYVFVVCVVPYQCKIITN